MFHGRFKDMLKVGGENVAAAEVEAVLAKHPAVRLAQIVGLPDERLAEIPAAYVELENGQQASEQELIDFAKTQIASFKVPRSEEHTSELQSLMRISYAVFCLKKKKNRTTNTQETSTKYSNKIIKYRQTECLNDK